MSEPQLVLVLTMGRVASTAVYRTVSDHVEGRIFHAHSIDPVKLTQLAVGGLDGAARHVREGLEAIREMLGWRDRVKLVTLVRDPVARNMSAAFARVRRGRDEAALQEFIADGEATAEFWAGFDDDPLTWFDDEFRDILGIDVYEHPFPDAGATTFTVGPYDVLIMRQELSDSEKSQQLESFLEVDPLPIRQTNRRSRPGGDLREVYDQFKRTAPLGREELTRIATSRFMQHFYRGTDPSEYAARWSDPATATR